MAVTPQEREELTDLDGCFGVGGNEQLVFGLKNFLADVFQLLEDRVGFGDFFLTWVFCTRTG